MSGVCPQDPGSHTHTHTRTRTYNKSQCVLSKRSAEPGQTEGGSRTSTGAEPVRQLPTFFVSSVHGHPTSALAKVTCTRSICCSYFWATCRPLFTSDASANCSPKYLLVTLKYCGRHHSSGSRVWSHISHGMKEIKLRWMRMIVSGLWGGNAKWHHRSSWTWFFVFSFLFVFVYLSGYNLVRLCICICLWLYFFIFVHLYWYHMQCIYFSDHIGPEVV